MTAFRRGLSETGYVEGHNGAIEYRWGTDQYDRLPEMSAALVRCQVAVIFAPGNIADVVAATTTTTPIVFSIGANPVATGLVASLTRPGCNLTGMTLLGAESEPKRLEILPKLVLTAAVIGALAGSGFLNDEIHLLPATTGKSRTQSLGSCGLPAARSDNFLDQNGHVPKNGLKLGDSVRKSTERIASV